MDGEVSVADQPSVVRADVGGRLMTTARWRWLVFLLACSAVFLVSFRHTLFLMVDTWYKSRTYSHCFLIVPVFLYLVWACRERVMGLQPVPSYWGLPLLGGLAFIWVVGNLGEVRVVQEFAVVAILIAVVWTLLGTVMVRVLIFPLLFLFFAVPFGTGLIRPLQNFTARFVIRALNISNVPAVLENHTISLPTSVWQVVEACSGIRFLLSAVVLGAVFSFLMYRSPWRRLIFMCASVVAPIAGNGLRAYGIVMLAYLTNNKVAVGVDHIVYGGLFAVMIEVVLMVIGLRWREQSGPVGQIASDHPDVTTVETKEVRSPGKDAAFVAVAAAALIVIAPLLATHLWNRASATTAWPDPPVTVNEPWQVTEASDLSWAPEWHSPDREFSRSYEYKTNRVDLAWVLFSGRHEMDFAPTSDGTTSSKTWWLVSDSSGSAIIDGRHVQVHRSLLQSGRTSRAVWTWYWVSGEYTTSRTRVRYLQAKARLLGKPAAVAVTSLGVDRLTDDSEGEQVLQEFLLHAAFPTTATPPDGCPASQACAQQPY